MFECLLEGNVIKARLTSINQSYNFIIPNNKSFLNKVQFVFDDLKFISEIEPSFEEFFQKLYDYVKTGLVVFNEDYIFSNLDNFASTLVMHRVPDYKKFCDSSKRTKDSIFFDESEMFELLKLISVFKFISPIIHSDAKDKYSASVQDLLNLVADKYSHINKKLYQVITSKILKGSMTNKKFMNFLKFSLTYDYLILYNFSFITNVLICLYNWTKNPVSFIVSLAGENFNFLVMTYSQVPIVYSSDEVEIDVSSGDYLDSISYEMILQNIFDNLQKENVTVKDLYPTPITDIIVVPLVSVISDIPTSQLERKSNYDKLMLQYLLSMFLNKNKLLRSSYPDVIKNVLKLFLYAFEIPVQYGEGITPSMLEVLKHDFTYYSLDNKIPILNAVKTYSCFVTKRKFLRNIVSGEAFPEEYSKQIQDLLKSLAQFTMIVVSDDTRDEIRKELKRQFIDFLGKVKLNKSMLGLYL